jgi:malonate transporter
MAAALCMAAFFHYLGLSAPLFGVVMLGYGLAHLPRWRREWTRWATRFVFAVPLPALLFHMMSDRSKAAPVDARLLVAFFGSCFIVFILGRLVAHHLFRLDGVAGSVFALGGVFSNNVLLGVPLARLTLGPEALPHVAFVLIFNALTLWTLVTVSVEWARHGALSFGGLLETLLAVLANPIIIGILAGTLFRFSGLLMPTSIDTVLEVIGRLAGPLALLVLGMGISEYGIRDDWQQSLAICALKLVVQPLVVWGLALALGLPPLERQVVVLLGSLSVGANVYLMSAQFDVLAGPVASSLVLSTLLAAVTTPLLLAALSALG